MLCTKPSWPISALTFGSSSSLDLASLLSSSLKDPPARIDYCELRDLLPSSLLQNENNVVSQQCNQREPDVTSCHLAKGAQLDPNTHTCWCSTAFTSLSKGIKTTNRGEELRLATTLGLTVSEFHAGLSGCRWFIPPPAFEGSNISSSAASGAAPLRVWGDMAGDQEEAEKNQCHDSEVIRQPQITTEEEMSGPEHRRGFVWVFFSSFCFGLFTT